MPEKGKNAARSSVTGMSSDRENAPLSDVAPDDSAGKRGHGAHGTRGHTPAEREDAANPEPDGTQGSDRGGSAGWGSAASGGSTIDKRGPEGK